VPAPNSDGKQAAALSPARLPAINLASKKHVIKKIPPRFLAKARGDK